MKECDDVMQDFQTKSAQGISTVKGSKKVMACFAVRHPSGECIQTNLSGRGETDKIIDSTRAATSGLANTSVVQLVIFEQVVQLVINIYQTIFSQNRILNRYGLI